MNPDSGPGRFSTDDVPERERQARWPEESGRTPVRVEVEPDAPIWAEAILQRLPAIGVGSCAGSTARLHRTHAPGADSADLLGLIVNLGDPAHASQRGIEVTLGKGDAVLVHPDEPCMLRCSQHFGLLFSRAGLAMRTNVDAAAMRVIPASDDALRLLVDYLRLVQADTGLKPPLVQQTIADHIHDLAALAIGANRNARERAASAIAAARLADALEDISRHFVDPDLTLGGVARRQGISSRYLQELLERSGVSFTTRVTELRLRRAFALLTRFPDRQVSDVAAQAGFPNVSHFNRAFRRRFGDSPSGVRARS